MGNSVQLIHSSNNDQESNSRILTKLGKNKFTYSGVCSKNAHLVYGRQLRANRLKIIVTHDRDHVLRDIMEKQMLQCFINKNCDNSPNLPFFGGPNWSKMGQLSSFSKCATHNVTIIYWGQCQLGANPLVSTSGKCTKIIHSSGIPNYRGKELIKM